MSTAANLASKNDDAKKIFVAAIGNGEKNTKGTFVYFVDGGSLSLSWQVEILEKDGNPAELVFSVHPTRFRHPDTPGEIDLIRLAYLRFVRVATELCLQKKWDLSFEALDTILHDILQPKPNTDKSVARWIPTRKESNFAKNFDNTTKSYEQHKIADLGNGPAEGGGESTGASAAAGDARAKEVAKELDARLERSRLSQADRDTIKGIAERAMGKNKDLTAKQIANIIVTELSNANPGLLRRKPFWACRYGNCDTDICGLDEYGCPALYDDTDSLLWWFGSQPSFWRPRRRPYRLLTDPERIIVLGRSGRSAGADALRRAFPGKEVHVRKWGPSADSFLRENPLTPWNTVQVHAPSRASRSSLLALARGRRRGADLSFL